MHETIKAAGQGHILELPRGCSDRRRRPLSGLSRADLPAAWAGLANGDLAAVCGIEAASFCHNGRFIAAARSRGAALAMAKLAVKEALSIGV